MTPEEREQFYDTEIAPVLLEIARKCQDNGISLVAMAEWHPGETGRTATLTQGAGFGIRLAHTAMQARGNVDSLIFAMQRYGKEHGHTSICLSMLERQPS